MLNFIKKYKLLVILLIIFITVALLSLRSEISSPTVPSSLTPTPIPFELISFFPPKGERPFPIENLALLFTFSKPVNVSTTVVKIKPSVNFNTSVDDDGTTLSVYPISAWVYNTEYSVTIEAVSAEGEKLSPPIEYSFKPIQFTDSPLTE